MPHASQGWATGVLMNPYLFQELFFFFFVSPDLDPEWAWMPEAYPGEDTVSYCAIQKSLQGAAGSCFSPRMIHRQCLLGFISGASLLTCPFLTPRSRSSDAQSRDAVSFFKELAVTQWFFSLVREEFASSSVSVPFLSVSVLSKIALTLGSVE